MVQPTRPPRNSFVAKARKIYNPVGFSKGYNFVLWFIFAGALFGFTLARLQYLAFYSIFCPRTSNGPNHGSPGECYYYLNFDQYKVGIILHLACVLPSGILAILQFVPAIRHKAILFHRINGYVALTLFVLGTVGALMIARHAFGGGLDVQSAIGFLAIISIGSFILSYINIKRKQIEQHRAWMLRGWFYVSPSVLVHFIPLLRGGLIVNTRGDRTVI